MAIQSDAARNVALPAITSLLSKSEKAQVRVAPGTWQYDMLQHNIEALRVAQLMLSAERGATPGVGPDELEAATSAFASMISRSEAALVKFAEGTSQHTLLTNRIRALALAKSLAREGLEPPNP